VRSAIFSHFAASFEARNVKGPGADNLQFRTLSSMEGVKLIKLFRLEEVKATIWDCDSHKSPKSDGINFGFLKDFWDNIKDGIMRFIIDFHQNGRLTKGIYFTFITLFV